MNDTIWFDGNPINPHVIVWDIPMTLELRNEITDFILDNHDIFAYKLIPYCFVDFCEAKELHSKKSGRTYVCQSCKKYFFGYSKCEVWEKAVYHYITSNCGDFLKNPWFFELYKEQCQKMS